MPRHGEYQHVKEWLQDHDTAEVNEAPPVQNTWYEVFHDQDVRLLLCRVRQSNTEVAAKDVEVRWTIDGNVYLVSASLDDTSTYWVFREETPSTGGTAGLATDSSRKNATYYVDKRGLDFKVEVRMTSVPGTNQTLLCQCVYETLEVT